MNHGAVRVVMQEVAAGGDGSRKEGWGGILVKLQGSDDRLRDVELVELIDRLRIEQLK